MYARIVLLLAFILGLTVQLDKGSPNPSFNECMKCLTNSTNISGVCLKKECQDPGVCLKNRSGSYRFTGHLATYTVGGSAFIPGCPNCLCLCRAQERAECCQNCLSNSNCNECQDVCKWQDQPNKQLSRKKSIKIEKKKMLC